MDIHPLQHKKPPGKKRIVSWAVNTLIVCISAAIILAVLRWKFRTPGESDGPENDFRSIRVQVLNGCGVAGMAGTVREYLMRYNVDVREIGNAGFYVSRTIVMDRLGNREKAVQIARLFGLDETGVIEQVNRSLIDIDVSVIIGKDYRKYYTAIRQREKEYE